MTVTMSRRQRRVVLVADREIDGLDLSAGPDEFATENEVAVVVRPFECFDVFVVTHSKTLVRCAYLIVGDASTAQVVLQIALVKVAKLDNRDRLRRALAELPRRQRAAVVLRHYLDLDEAATAAALGCSIGTVKSQTAKGLARLRTSIDSETIRRP